MPQNMPPDIPLHFGSAPLRLETSRVLLRPLVPDDAEALQSCASAQEIADDMISIPHPYPEGEASRFIATHAQEFLEGHSVVFALERKSDCTFCGIIEIRDVNRAHFNAELSFWLAVHSWGNGYMSEALALAVDYAFRGLRVNRLHAFHMVRNATSGKVLGKNGFQPEGLLRQCVWKCGQFEDVVLMAQLREDWDQRHGAEP